jgi:uncharacterized protein Yka (UPF0111/DUF47 family)
MTDTGRSLISESGISRLVGRVFPKTPDFFGLLQAQSSLAVVAMATLVEFMDTGEKAQGKQVKHMEHEGDVLKEQSMAALNRAFSTPIDREDLYRAISTLHHVVNYAKTTVREMEVLRVEPDTHTLTMSQLLHQGALALDGGYSRLAKEPGNAEDDAIAARMAERNVEKAYRRALAELFDPSADLERIANVEGPTGPAAVSHVMEVFKRREIYRHLSNAGDRVAHAGECLHDIVVKMV